ncbi:MAG: LemA family protein [Gammaproteobacteria bacterium]|nr:MAG: LemA family protein [Gammaproteobacteria bacterium]
MISAGILIAVLAGGIWIFNRLVKDRNQVRNAWSDIDVQLRRRHDLVPQLVNAVKAYADYEKATLTAVTELRTRSEAASHLPEKAALEDAMESGLHRLVAVAEDYPDLKADENFRQLQESLLDVEDHLQYARRFYNGAVRIFNTRIESFPHLLLARPLKFVAAEFFEAEANERIAPSVELSS